MKPFFRSSLRVLAVTVVTLAGLLGLTAAAITQPTFSITRRPDGPRADPERLRRHVELLTREVWPRDSDHPENLDRAAVYLRDQFAASRVRVTTPDFHVHGRTYRNVVASFGPEAGPILIVGAHYDSFGGFGANPGADDNASGTAGLLELARLLAGHRLEQRVDLVAFANEEPPYFGSAQMGSAVHARSLAGREVRGMICLEMIGYFTPRQPSPNWLFRFLYPNRGDFIAVAGRWADRELTRQVKRAMRGGSDLPVVSFTAPRSAGLDGSDQINYWDRGIPAVMVTDTADIRNPHYHSPLDTAETLDYPRMARVVDGVTNAVLAICGKTAQHAASMLHSEHGESPGQEPS
ncbi:MAG: M28 family peptidase [Thermoanaerobaculia bacterium]